MIKVKEISNELLTVSFDYDIEIVKKVKQVKGRRWNNADKLWYVDNTDVNKHMLKVLFKDEGIEWLCNNSQENKNKDICRHKDKGESEVIIKYHKYLVIKGFSPKTITAYKGHIKRFLQFCDKNAYEVDR